MQLIKHGKFVVAMMLLAAAGCSSSPTPAPKPTTPVTQSGRPSTASSLKPPPPPASAASLCRRQTQGWKTSAPAFDPHGPTPDRLSLSDITINQMETSRCWDLVSLTVLGGHVAYSDAAYVSPGQIVSDARGEHLPQVQAPAVLRLAVKAPLHFGDGAPPPAGTQLIRPSDLVGSNVVGVWYGGGSENQSLFYIGVNARRPLQAGLEVGPVSSIVDIKLAK